MGLHDSCCRMSPRNDTTTSGAEINLSRQEKDKTNHLLQESHLMPVSKSTGMNGFCKDRTATCFFFPFSPLFCKLRSIGCAVEAIPELLLAAPMLERRSRCSVSALATCRRGTRCFGLRLDETQSMGYKSNKRAGS